MAAHEITNLLYRYAELIDGGDLEGAAALFDHAEIILDPANNVSTDAAGILALWKSMITMGEDGTPGTKHVITNPIVHIDGATATCRSYYTVLHALTPGELAPVAAGRYHDEFEQVDGAWRFTRRDYSLLDLTGDLARHLGGG